ncbi:hypothetical protein D3C85_1105800 [compost metagenome]
MHQVQCPQLRVGGDEEGRQYGEILGHVVGDGEGGQGAPGDQQLLAHQHHVQQLGGVGVQIHQVARLLGGLGAFVHGQTHVRLGQGRCVVGTVTAHGDHAAIGLLLADIGQLLLRGCLGDEVIHPGLGGDGGGGQRVVPGDHHGADPHVTQDLEAGLDAWLDDVLEVHHPQQLLVGADQQRGTALTGDVVDRLQDKLGHSLAIEGEVVEHRIHGPLAILMTVAIQTAQPGLGAEGDHLVALELARLGHALAGQGQDGLALGGVVAEGGQHGGLGQQGGIDPGGRDQLVGHAVAEGDGACLVQQQGAHVTGGLHGTT